MTNAAGPDRQSTPEAPAPPAVGRAAPPPPRPAAPPAPPGVTAQLALPAGPAVTAQLALPAAPPRPAEPAPPKASGSAKVPGGDAPQPSVPPPVAPKASGSAKVPVDDPQPGDRPPPAKVPVDAPQPGDPTPAKKSRRGLIRLIAALVLLAAATSGVTVQLRRTLPSVHLTADVASTLRIPGPSPSLPWPSAGSAELMIEGLGRLGGKHADTAAPIGSVAKVMTAYLILKHHPLAGDEPGPQLTVTAADVADYRARIPGGQSLVRIAAGEQLTERQALEALLLPSANNVAHMLAVWDAGSAGAFVTSMNDAATELGMTGTRYTDPSGFLPSTTSTPADQVTLARSALKMPVFADIVAEPSATIPVAGRIKTYNGMLGQDGVFGVKTGSTSQAGGNLLFASRLELDGTVLTVVGAVFNQPGSGTPDQLARANTAVRRLLAAVRSAVRNYSILPVRPVGQVTTAWGDRVSVSPAGELKVIGWPGLRVPVKITTSAPGAEVRSGAVVGQVEARPGASAVRVDLRADAATSKPSLWWKLTRKP